MPVGIPEMVEKLLPDGDRRIDFLLIIRNAIAHRSCGSRGYGLHVGANLAIVIHDSTLSKGEYLIERVRTNGPLSRLLCKREPLINTLSDLGDMNSLC